MGTRKILPGIHAKYDDDEVVFICEGEPIEDMEFDIEDLQDSELLAEVAEELVEYLEDEADSMDNPIKVAMRSLRRLRDELKGKDAPVEDDYDEDEDDDY